MLNALIKPFKITKDNPLVVLYLASYFMISVLITPILTNTQGIFVIFALSLIVLFNCAFFAGWFGMIKKAVLNSEKVYENKEDKYKDILNLKETFFESVPKFILPVLTVFAIYYILFTFYLILCAKFATHFIGDITFLLEDMKNNSLNPSNTMVFLQTLPNEKLQILYGWHFFILFAIGVFGLFTMFLTPSLYYELESKRNPIRAFINSFVAVIKKPLETIGLDIIIAILFFITFIVKFISIFNMLTFFLSVIFTIYMVTYMVVLLFYYYEKHFALNCDNGADGIQQD